ncbi:MAG: hypothetical protein J7M18_03550, partial [Candidatus Eremiobacteraeota bacterium]|nr:hypothetical protein [Candidatus Eremiobacteraeota bacterium]
AYGRGRELKVTSAKSSYWQSLGNHAWAYLGYHYQDVDGVTPFLSDSFDSYNFISGGLRFHNRRYWSMNIFAAYDYKTRKYQQVFSNIRAAVGKESILSVGANYDLEESKFRGFDGQFDLKLSDSLRIQYWGYYDDRIKKMTYQDYSIYHDNHCWAARLTYRMSQQQFWIHVMLKAFPSDDVPIGARPNTVIMPQNWWERIQP